MNVNCISPSALKRHCTIIGWRAIGRLQEEQPPANFVLVPCTLNRLLCAVFSAQCRVHSRPATTAAFPERTTATAIAAQPEPNPFEALT